MNVTLNKISKEFKTKKKTTTVFVSASAEFPTDSVNVILGESGLGKTTLLGMISGLLAPDSGTVLFNGEQVEKERFFKDGIVSYVSVDNNVIESLTVLDNLRLFCKDQTKIDNFIKKVGLERQSKTLARKLSRGEHLRLAFARLFLNPGQVILLDEPTANLDSKNSQEIWGMIRKLAIGHNVLVSTNNRSRPLALPTTSLR